MAGIRRYSRKAVALGVAFGMVLLVAGLMTPAIVRAFSSNPTAHVRQLSTTRTLNDRLVMTPAPAGVQPRIDAEAAVAELTRQDGRLGKLDSVDVTLALITDTQYGRTNADDSVTPYYKDRLAWVITAQGMNLTGGIGGPDLPPDHPQRGKPRPPCSQPAYFVVDATSGAALYAIQSC